ncbi:hypothetical protein [Cohnella yongneupensis]|uniref:NHL repeat-containing protein n=1 Tax=Cohnella yongneupensis TaxID=425006 RepID=A0ABW0QW52_9BACL
MIVGSNSHTYRVVQGWAKWPASVQAGYTHGIVTDSEDRVYVFHTGTPSIVVFTEQGEFIRAFGHSFEGGAHGFYLHRDQNGEFLYVTDTNRGLMVKLTLEGEELLKICVPDAPGLYDAERPYVPTDVAVGPTGDIYISDGYGQNWIHRYSSEGVYIQSWGGTGSEPGQFQCPHGLSVNPRSREPELYVADRGNSRIQVFTMDGQFKRMFDNDMDQPCSFFFAGDEMYFPDLHSRYTIFDKNDTLITHLGEDQRAYKQPGWPNLPKEYYRDDRFSSPHGVCVDSRGNVYAAEWIADGRVTKLERL